MSGTEKVCPGCKRVHFSVSSYCFECWDAAGGWQG